VLESEFTPPSDFCPNPHYWHSHDGMATEVEVLELVAAFVRALQPEVVVETGTHRGFGAEAIGQALQRNGHGHLYTTEIDERLHAEASARVHGLPVTCLLASAMDFVPPAPIDFAWFDSETNLRVPEFREYRQYMHGRTLVGFHDTSPHHGYRPLLDDLGIALLDLPTPRGVTFGRIR
jgi:predicted O-methyltransferase YrrM